MPLQPTGSIRLTAAKRDARRERQLFADSAYRELKRRILENEWHAGFQALEQELADVLGMSRTPVREAMIRLANEGLVEIRPRHGMRVLPVSPDDMRQIYEILTALEAMAAELAARQRLTAKQIDALRESVVAMDEALQRDDLAGWAAADERFHLLLTEYSGNERLKTLVETFWDQSHRVRMLTLGLRPRPVESNTDHAAVVQAIIDGDAEAAREVHRRHRERNGRLLIEILQRHLLTAV